MGKMHRSFYNPSVWYNENSNEIAISVPYPMIPDEYMFEYRHDKRLKYGHANPCGLAGIKKLVEDDRFLYLGDF